MAKAVSWRILVVVAALCYHPLGSPAPYRYDIPFGAPHEEGKRRWCGFVDGGANAPTWTTQMYNGMLMKVLVPRVMQEFRYLYHFTRNEIGNLRLKGSNESNLTSRHDAEHVAAECNPVSEGAHLRLPTYFLSADWTGWYFSERVAGAFDQGQLYGMVKWFAANARMMEADGSFDALHYWVPNQQELIDVEGVAFPNLEISFKLEKIKFGQIVDGPIKSIADDSVESIAAFQNVVENATSAQTSMGQQQRRPLLRFQFQIPRFILKHLYFNRLKFLVDSISLAARLVGPNIVGLNVDYDLRNCTDIYPHGIQQLVLKHGETLLPAKPQCSDGMCTAVIVSGVAIAPPRAGHACLEVIGVISTRNTTPIHPGTYLLEVLLSNLFTVPLSHLLYRDKIVIPINRENVATADAKEGTKVDATISSGTASVDANGDLTFAGDFTENSFSQTLPLCKTPPTIPEGKWIFNKDMTAKTHPLIYDSIGYNQKFWWQERECRYEYLKATDIYRCMIDSSGKRRRKRKVDPKTVFSIGFFGDSLGRETMFAVAQLLALASEQLNNGIDLNTHLDSQLDGRNFKGEWTPGKQIDIFFPASIPVGEHGTDSGSVDPSGNNTSRPITPSSLRAVTLRWGVILGSPEGRELDVFLFQPALLVNLFNGQDLESLMGEIMFHLEHTTKITKKFNVDFYYLASPALQRSTLQHLDVSRKTQSRHSMHTFKKLKRVTRRKVEAVVTQTRQAAWDKGIKVLDGYSISESRFWSSYDGGHYLLATRGNTDAKGNTEGSASVVHPKDTAEESANTTALTNLSVSKNYENVASVLNYENSNGIKRWDADLNRVGRRYFRFQWQGGVAHMIAMVFLNYICK